MTIVPIAAFLLLWVSTAVSAQTRYRSIPAPTLDGAMLTIRASSTGEVELVYASARDDGLAKVPMILIAAWADSTERMFDVNTQTRPDEELEFIGPTLSGKAGTGAYIVRRVQGNTSEYELCIDGGWIAHGTVRELTQSQARALVQTLRAAGGAAKELTPPAVAARQAKSFALRANNEQATSVFIDSLSRARGVSFPN